MVDLGKLAPLSGTDSSATGINDAGQVIGQYGTSDPLHPFLYDNGAVTGLPEPSFTGGSGREAMSINNSGQIAGACGDTSGNAHLVLWQNGVMVGGSSIDSGGTVQDLNTLIPPGPATRSGTPPPSTTTVRSSPTPPAAVPCC